MRTVLAMLDTTVGEQARANIARCAAVDAPVEVIMSDSDKQQQKQQQGRSRQPNFDLKVTYDGTNNTFDPPEIDEYVTNANLTSIIRIVGDISEDAGDLRIVAGPDTPAEESKEYEPDDGGAIVVTFPHPSDDDDVYEWELDFVFGIVVKLSVKIRKTPPFIGNTPAA